uniref:Putative ovule protein n=1 Tax=Solanum chacoense TaxID=4108 RepID=A0A0V0H599_SOLCH
MSDLVCQLFKSLLQNDREHFKPPSSSKFDFGFCKCLPGTYLTQFIGYSIYFLSIKSSLNSESQYILGSIVKHNESAQ